MNITDIKINWEAFKGLDMIQVIFTKQQELMNFYKIRTLDLDIPHDQQTVRAIAWSVIEEAGEAMEVIQKMDRVRNPHTNEVKAFEEHLGDELADMFHFYLEFLIMSGLTHQDMSLYIYQLGYGAEMNVERDNIEHSLTRFIVAFSLSVNVLKNRMWRESNLKTDMKKYQDAARETIPLFFIFIWSLGISTRSLIDYYLRKNEVNLFRIRSKY